LFENRCAKLISVVGMNFEFDCKNDHVDVGFY
jgi:hypothetical protein